MGPVRCLLRISSLDGQRSREVEATVDAGTAYTVLPAQLLRDLCMMPVGRRRLLLSDGQRTELESTEAQITVAGDHVTTIVLFGDDDGPSVLGAYSLAGLGLAVDPVTRELVQSDPIMYQELAGYRAADR